MTKQKYVNRLKKMLKKHYYTAGCHCPATPWFNPILMFIPRKTCKMCQEFVGIFDQEDYSDLRSCPCTIFGGIEAVQRAVVAIQKYEDV